MTFIIILIIVIAIVIVIRKASSGKKSNDPVPATTPSNYSLIGIPEEEVPERDNRFESIMLRPQGDELTNCYNQIRKLFIPTKKDGTFEGAFSGRLGTGTRAKTLEKIDQTVFSILGDNQEEYELWYTVLYDRIFNEQMSSGNGKLRGAAMEIYRDAMAGDAVLYSGGFMDMLNEPEQSERDVEITTESARAKIKFRISKDCKLTYTIKKLYKWFPEGLNMEDPLIHAAEILIAISSYYEFSDGCTTFKSEIEKHTLPHIR